MKYIELTSTNPFFNLAAEEYVFEELDRSEAYFMLWQNQNSIIVGKHQNTVEEINLPFVKANDIRVARRLTGGGAVYHDKGNLNFTFITDKKDAESFQVFTKPVLRLLRRLGVPAEFSGRNDLTIQGMKFSGNSQYVRGDRVLAHGCIMLDANVDYLSQALTAKKEKYRSRGIQSVVSRVTCINDHLQDRLSMAQFKSLLRQVVSEETVLEPYDFTEGDLKRVQRLCSEKYATWEWNYGESPRYNAKCEKKFPAGLITAYIDVYKGRIQQIRFYGDFFGSEDLVELEEAMKGLPLHSRMEEALERLDISRYMNGITAKDITDLLLSY